ncbi:hypothetical protein [Prescottella agglutinans]|uniref:hypothetical protein n=1 Tax=Prescottella agglutinans TaxID=1644129 RepID=UPI003D98A4BB
MNTDVEERFQDRCDDGYGDRSERERKRRLGRRPSDNKMVTAMVLLPRSYRGERQVQRPP